MTKSVMQKLIEDAGYEARSYSGRGMNGKQCLGVETGSSAFSLVADLIGAAREYEEMELDGDALDALQEALRNVQSDSLGHDRIIYFPNILFVRDIPLSSVEDDDLLGLPSVNDL